MRSRRPLPKVVLLAATVAGVAVTSDAHAGELVLTWEAPAECPSRDEVLAAATRKVVGGAASRSGASLHATAKVTKDVRWRVRLQTTRGHGADATTGERAFDASTCGELADATALVLALALVPAGSDAPAATISGTVPPASASGAGAVTPAPTSEAPTAAAIPTEERPGPAEAPASSTSAPAISRDRATGAPRDPSRTSDLLRFGVGASGSLATAILPSPVPGATVALAWMPGRMRVAIGAGVHAAQSATAGASGAGARFRMRTASGSVCASLLRAPVDLAPCAGATIHDVDARGTGVAESFDPKTRWVTADGGLRVAYPLGRAAALTAQGDVLVALARPTFVVEGEGHVHRPAALGGRFALGAEIHFP